MEEAVKVELSDEDVRCFREDGFRPLGRMTTDFELTWLKYIHDAIIQELTRYELAELERMPPDALVKLPIVGGYLHESLITILAPEKVVPDLKDSLFLRNARRVFARLLGLEEDGFRTGWRIFCKPANGSETPWHQDAAYRIPPHTGASIWLPLDPATFETSCLSYLGGSHLKEIHPHHLHDEHMVAEGVDATGAVACPGAAGEAIAHHCRTLHYAGPNRTDQTRRAFVIVCRVISQ